MMEKDNGFRKAMESDLGLNAQFVKGQNIPVRNCWHFSTDGNLVDFLFRDDDDFVAGVNRIFLLRLKYRVVILAYCLMDTHVHFILYGELEECKRFMHEYIRLTSMYLSKKYRDLHKLNNLFPDYQVIDNDRYLKTAICYVIKNPSVAGLPYNALDYPWSSGALLFRSKGNWCSMGWESSLRPSMTFPKRELRQILKTRYVPDTYFNMIDSMVFPGDIVDVTSVERIFRTHRAFHFFMCHSTESDVESVAGSISRLSIPYQELHQHKQEFCMTMFGSSSIRSLSTEQRLKLAMALKARFNSSSKQIAKVCGLVYAEVRSML